MGGDASRTRRGRALPSADMSDPFGDEGLDQNRANYVPLTPLAFLARTARVYPQRSRHLARRDSPYLGRDGRASSSLGQRAAGAWDRARRTWWRRCCRTFPAMIEAHFGVAWERSRAQRAQIRGSMRPRVAFMLEHGGAKAILVDRELGGGGAGRPRAARSSAAGDRLRRSRVPRRRRTQWLARLRGRSLEEGDPAFEWEGPPDEVGCDLPQLHLGHHRQSEGGSCTTTAAPI